MDHVRVYTFLTSSTIGTAVSNNCITVLHTPSCFDVYTSVVIVCNSD